MTDTTDTMTWEQYRPDLHRGKGGVYVFLFKNFENAPFYVGRSDNFRNRFNVHERLFRSGGRTYMRPSFSEKIGDRSHKGFVSRWMQSKDRTDLKWEESLVWVPENGRVCPDEICRESTEFWSKKVVRLVFSFSDGRSERSAIERQVQNDVYSYYENLSAQIIEWSLPPQSFLFGGGRTSTASSNFLYRFDDKPRVEPHVFFSKLSSLRPD